MKTLTTDICIIGSGMGGGTLALALARLGYCPLLLEAGPATSGSTAVSHVETGRPLGLPTTRAIEVGGSTNLWHGVCSPLDPFDFTRPGADSYHTWPVHYSEMQPYWTQAMSFLGFDHPEQQRVEDLPTHLHSLRDDIPHSAALFKEKLFRVLAHPKRLKPALLAAHASGKIVLKSDCVAHQLHAEQNSPARVKWLLASNSGEKLRVEAKAWIVAAGALESPRLLLNSPAFAQRATPADLGHVGQCLMDHPMGFLGKLKFRRRTRAPLFSDLPETKRNRYRLGLVPHEPDELGNSNLYIRPSSPGESSDLENDILLSLTALRGLRGLRANHIAKLLAHPKVAYRAVANRFALPISYTSADLFFVMEQTPFRDSKVALSDACDAFGFPKAAVHWQISDNDRRRMSAYINRVAKSGLHSAQYELAPPPDTEHWEKCFTSAAHHLGTLRMAPRQEQGVVDTNLKVFGSENTWICDGSVFPTGGNANPSLTICALAHRLADQLDQLLKSK